MDASHIYLAALLFDGLRNVKFNSIKTDISNQALQVKDAVPRTYDKVLKLVGGWKSKSSIIHNNNSDNGVAMVHPGGPGHGYQGSRGCGKGRGGRDGRGSDPGRGRGGGGRGAQNQQQKQSEGEKVHPEAKKLPSVFCFHCQGNHYVRKCPELASDQKS